ASGVLAKDSLTVARYDVNVLEGHASGQATLQFALPRAWTLQARAEQLNSTLLHARTPGRVSFTAAASGRGLDKRADFDIALANVRGTINGERLRGLGNVERRGRRWRIEDLHLELGGTALDLNARIADTVDARWSFKSPALDVLLPQAKGKLELAGTARGPRDTPRITGRLRGSDLRYGEWSSATLDIEGDIDVSNAQPSTLTIAARKAGFGTRLVETIDARGEGTALDHRIAMEVVGTSDDPAAAPRALMQVLGKYENEEWSATVATTQFSRGDPTHALEIAE